MTCSYSAAAFDEDSGYLRERDPDRRRASALISARDDDSGVLQPAGPGDDIEEAISTLPARSVVSGARSGWRMAHRIALFGRGAGPSTRLLDAKRMLALACELVRREHPEWDEDRVSRAGEDILREWGTFDEGVAEEALKLLPISCAPRRDTIRGDLEVAAGRRHRAIRELEALLARAPSGGGRRSKSYRVEIALLERMAWGYGRPEVKSALQGLEGSNRELDFAYLDTEDPGEIRNELRDVRTHTRVLKSMLDRSDPHEALKTNLTIMRDIALRNIEEVYVNRRWQPQTAIGRYLAIDGCFIEAHSPQYRVSGREQEELLVGRPLDAAFGVHGENKTVRGWNLVTITDLKSGLPLWAKLVSANRAEAPLVPLMLSELFTAAPWIDEASEVLVADGGFGGSKQLAFDIEARFGLHPVIPLRSNVAGDLASTRGVPSCAQHGLMKLVKREGFGHKDPANPLRWDRTLTLGYEHYRNLSKARTRWKCEACGINATTWLRDDPRLHGYLPRGGSHVDARRFTALQLRRNLAEAVNSCLQHHGIANRTHERAKWVSTHRQMEWLVYTALLGMTLRRDAFESGRYTAITDEAMTRGLVKRPVALPPGAPPASNLDSLPVDADDPVVQVYFPRGLEAT